MRIRRTSLALSKENITEDFAKRAFALGALSNAPQEVIVEDKYSGIHEKSGAQLLSWYEGAETLGYVKTLNTVELTAEKHDTDIIIWQTGRMQGWKYTDRRREAQYAADPVAWVNLLLEYGFLEEISE